MREARELARRALTRLEGWGFRRLRSKGRAAGGPEAARPTLGTLGAGFLIQTFADADPLFGITKTAVGSIVATGELTTLKISDLGARMVTRTEVEGLRLTCG